MSDNNFVDPNTDDLDAFSDLFNGHAKEAQSEDVEQASSAKEEVDNSKEDADAPLEQNHETDTTEDDNNGDTDESDESEDKDKSEPEPAAKPKKNRFQERIDDLTGKQKEAERRLNEALQKIEQLQNPVDPTPKKEVSNGPTPDDTNEDGTDKYPLGEFDPKYVADLTRHMFAEAQREAKEEEAKTTFERTQREAQEALAANWQDKMIPAQERYPDFQEKGEQLVSTFDGLDQNYSDYLVATLQSMEFGPDVLYYLANNVDEAKRIVGLGATGATIALGRIEAKFAFADEEKQRARPKVSKAPTPPPANKGSAVSHVEVPDDTDDLDAFAEKLFNSKRR